MALGLVVMSGRITDGTSSTSPEVEIWSSSIGGTTTSGGWPETFIDEIASACGTWFTAANTRIHSTVTLDTVKANLFDIATGLQITDPTVEHTYSPFLRGASTTIEFPITTSYRVSMDDGTRNRRARGGFYVPRPTLAVGYNGRFNDTNVGQALATAVTMLDAFVSTAAFDVGVWSRAGQSLTPSTRVRIGDVPDNIRRRKNDLRENYQSVALS